MIGVSAGGRSLTAWQALKATAGDWRRTNTASLKFLPPFFSLTIHSCFYIQTCADTSCCTETPTSGNKEKLHLNNTVPVLLPKSFPGSADNVKHPRLREVFSSVYTQKKLCMGAEIELIPIHWVFFSEISPFDDCTSSLSLFWLRRRMRAPGTRAMHAMASSCSSRSQENKSSSDDTSDSMTPVWTQMKLYGRRPTTVIKRLRTKQWLRHNKSGTASSLFKITG